MATEKNEREGEVFTCPVGRLFVAFEKACKPGPGFFEHLKLSRVEFLKAIRSLVDDRIGKLERCAQPGEKRATKIKVE